MKTDGLVQAGNFRHMKATLFVFALLFAFPGSLNLAGAVHMPQSFIYSRSRTAAEAIDKWAGYYGVDKDLAVRIAEAESSLNCKVKNKDSSAGGLFQFTNSTFLYAQKRLGKPQDLSKKFDCDESAELGVYLLSKGELHHWDASRSVWDQDFSARTATD